MARSKMEKNLKAIDELLEQKSKEADEILKTAEKEDRDPTEEDEKRIQEISGEVKDLRTKREEYQRMVDTEQEIRGKSIDLDNVTEVEIKSEPDKSIGQQFIESKGYQEILAKAKDGGLSSGSFSTGKIELKAGSLLEGGQGAGLIPVPQVIPGQVDTLFQRLSVADLIASGQTSVNSLRYVVEGTATNSAAAVAEGGTKPASDLALSTVDEPVKKIATVLTVSDEMLEDAPAVQSYINQRLSLFVKQTEEASLTSGAGTNDLVGILGRSGIHTYPAGTVDNNAVALFKAINGTRGSSFLEPDAIIMNPANWQNTRLLQDANNQFYGGGPFTGAYGNGGQGLGFGGQLSGQVDSIWTKPVVITTAVGVGTALLGSFRLAAQVFRRGGITVEATNSHASNFTSDLVTIRAEERLALAVYRPGAFTKVTGLNS